MRETSHMNPATIIFLMLIIIIVIGALSWLLVSLFSKKRSVPLPGKVFWALIAFDLIWLILSFIYASGLDNRTKGAGINDELYTAMLIIHGWIYYISAVLLIATGIWYIITRKRSKTKNR